MLSGGGYSRYNSRSSERHQERDAIAHDAPPLPARPSGNSTQRLQGTASVTGPGVSSPPHHGGGWKPGQRKPAVPIARSQPNLPPLHDGSPRPPPRQRKDASYELLPPRTPPPHGGGWLPYQRRHDTDCGATANPLQASNSQASVGNAYPPLPNTRQLTPDPSYHPTNAQNRGGGWTLPNQSTTDRRRQERQPDLSRDTLDDTSVSHALPILNDRC